MSPTQRSLKLLRELGYTVAVVEHWNAYAEIRQDLFGFIDLLALHPHQPGVLAVQTTARKSNFQARIKKILANHTHRLWLQTGNIIQVHGWIQEGPRKPWTCLTKTWAGVASTTRPRPE